MHIQSDLKFVLPPSGAVSLNEITVKQYLPTDGELRVFAEKGAIPHIIQGEHFRIQVGRKPAGRHNIAILTAAEPLAVKYGKEELKLDAGVYYVARADNRVETPLVQ